MSPISHRRLVVVVLAVAGALAGLVVDVTSSLSPGSVKALALSAAAFAVVGAIYSPKRKMFGRDAVSVDDVAEAFENLCADIVSFAAACAEFDGMAVSPSWLAGVEARHEGLRREVCDVAAAMECHGVAPGPLLRLGNDLAYFDRLERFRFSNPLAVALSPSMAEAAAKVRAGLAAASERWAYAI